MLLKIKILGSKSVVFLNKETETLVSMPSYKYHTILHVIAFFLQWCVFMYKFCEKKKIPKILLFRPPFLIYKKTKKEKNNNNHCNWL